MRKISVHCLPLVEEASLQWLVLHHHPVLGSHVLVLLHWGLWGWLVHVMYMSGIYLAESDDGPHHVHGHQSQVLHAYVNVCYSVVGR